MSKVILQPSGNKDAREHYSDTIEKSIPLLSIKPYISLKEFETLNDIYPSGECKIWGVTPGSRDNNITKWNRIEIGDVCLFSREGEIYASAVTTFKLHSKKLAISLWDFDNKGQTWEYIYFLEEVKTHSIPYLQFNKVVGYADNYVIQGFNVLDNEKSNKLLQFFDLESEIFIEDVSKENYEKILAKLENLKETETEISSTRRLEQGYLKKLLFGKKTIGTCAGCKKDYPVSFLVTAHIKKRAQCEPNERTDVNIVMPMCKMGCDEVFEKGYVSVSNGIFIDMNKTPKSTALQDYINVFSNTKCDYFNEKTEKYFNWHLKNT